MLFPSGLGRNTGVLKAVNITSQPCDVQTNLQRMFGNIKSVFVCRHVLDDTSGRSPEDDGEGLQRRRSGEDAAPTRGFSTLNVMRNLGFRFR